MLVKRFGTFLTYTTLSVLISGCSMNAEIASLFSPPPIHIADAPKVNYSNQDAITVTGTCMVGVTSFVISSPPPERTVNCVNGQWSVDLDLSNEPEGPIRIVTDKINPQTGAAIEVQVPKDTIPPILTSLILEQGQPITNKSIIAYRLTGDDIAQAYVTEDSTCSTGGAWQSAIATVPLALGDGSKTLYVKARDAAGNVTGCVLNASITLDQTPPIVTGLNDDFILKANKNWTWSCMDTYGPCTYSYVIGSVNSLDPFGVFTSIQAANLDSGDGVYYLSVQAKDMAGNLSDVQRVQVSLSTSLPYLRIENGAAYHPSHSVLLQLVHFENFDEVEISNTASCLTTTTLSSSSVVPWTLGSGDGLKSISYRFRNTTTSEVSSCYDASITVDTTNPVVTGLSDDSVLRKAKTWNWGCTDATACSYRFVIDQNSSTVPSGVFGALQTANLPTGDGTYYIHVQAQDVVGNQSDVVHVQVVLDNSLPVLNGLANVTTPVQSKTWTWSCADSNTCQARFLVDQNPSSSPSGAYSSTMTATRATGDGVYYIHVQLRDEVGNESLVQHYSAILDNTAPIITGLANDGIPKQSKDFSWSCTDTYGPCTYRYLIDQSPTSTPSGAYSSTSTVSQPDGEDLYYLHVQAMDVAGNETLTHVSFILDNTPPTVTMASATAELTNSSSIPVTVTFSEAVTGFTAADLSLVNATVSGFSGSGASYTFNLVPSGQGALSVGFAAGVAQDASGNLNLAATTLNRTYDSVKPGGTLASTSSAITTQAPVPVTLVLSEAVESLSANDFTVVNASIQNFTGSGVNYSFDLQPTSEGEVTVSLAAGALLDLAGNSSNAVAELSRIYDVSDPTVVLSSTSPVVTNVSPIPVAVSFSEVVTGFIASDIVVVNGAVSGFTGSGANYTFNVVPSGQGTVTIDIPAGRAVDIAGNGNVVAATLSRTYDNVKPTGLLSSSAPSSTSDSPIPFVLQFSEAVIDFEEADITVVNGSVTNFTGSGANYTFDVVPSASAIVTVSVAADVAEDSAGNTNSAVAAISRTYDNVKPSLILSSTATSSTNVSPFTVTAVFSKTVTGFTASDVVITNGSISGFTGSGTSYSFSVTPAAQGNVTVAVAANVAEDVSGNGNSAAGNLVRNYDSLRPTAVIASSAASSTKVSPIPFTITFSENVTGFVAADVAVTGGTVSGFTGSGASYSFNVTPSAQGDVTVAVAANVAQDAAGNLNQAATTVTRTYDNVVPSVTLATTATSPTNSSPLAFTATFSEAVTGFIASDISVTNGTVSGFTGSGTSYSFNVTPTAQGNVSVVIAAGVAQDSATNLNSASNSISRVFDTSKPTVTLASTAPATTNLASIPVTVVFSEAVTGFVVSDVVVTNGTVSGFSGSGASYSFNIAPTAAGTVAVNVAADVAVDTANNGNSAATTLTRTYDNVRPTVTIGSSAGASTNVSPIPFTVTFSETVTGFIASDITVAGGAISGFTGSGTSYSFNVTPSAQGNVTINVAAGVAADAVGNTNTAAAAFVRAYDNIRPGVTLASTAPSATNVAVIPVTVTFTEAVLNFVAADVVVTNGTVSGFSGSGASYSFNVTASASGFVTVAVAADVANDAAGNTNTAATSLSRTYDNARPTVTLSSTADNPTNAATIPVVITFSESVTGFIAGDITVTNGTVTSLSGSGASYSAVITPTAQGAVTVAVAANVAQDAAGNLNTAATSLSRTFDTTRPTVSLTTVASNPTNTSPISVTATFSEAVTGFALADITVSGGTASSLSGSGTTYTFNVAPSVQGLISISVPANGAEDAAGNLSQASATLTRTYDNVKPSVTLASTAPATTNLASIPVTVTFTEAVTGFIAGDVVVTNGTLSGFTGSGTSYSFNVAPTAAGTVTVAVAANVAGDSAGNLNNAATSLTRTFDNVRPSTTITSTTTSSTNVSPIPITVTFSKSVTGFAASDVAVTGGTITGVSGSGTTYTFNLNPSGSGTVTVAIPQGVAQDAVGNTNTAAATLTRTFDNVRPTVALTSSSAANINTASFSVTATFSEDVTGFVASDITVTNGSVGAVSGNGDVYTFTVTATAQGTVTVAIPASIATDAAGNLNLAATNLVRTFDSVKPTVTLSSTAASPTNSSTMPLTITFSEAVTGFVAGDITVTNGTVGTLSGGPTVYTTSITPSAQGAVTMAVAANVAQDASGNTNIAATSISRTYDSVKPSVTVTTTAGATNDSPIVYSVVFNEAVTGFAAADLSVGNGTATVSGSGTTYSVSVVPATSGNVSVTVVASGASDAAGNTNTASSAAVAMYDVVNPVPPTVTNAAYVAAATSAPAASWSGASDGHSGIARYEIAVGTSAGAANTKTWASVGTATSNTVTGLSLTANTNYYVSVRVVDNAGNMSAAVSGAAFKYIPTHTLSSISPNSGGLEGGARVTISGTNFYSPMTVTIGGNSCTSVTVSSTTSLSCDSPAHTVGVKTVTVTNPASQSVSLTNAYTYLSVYWTQVSAAAPSLATGSGLSALVTYTFSYGDKILHWSAASGGKIFNTSTNVWTDMPVTANSAPVRASDGSYRTFAAFGQVDQYVIFWGGYGSNDNDIFYRGATTNTGYVYNIETNTWSLMSTAGAPAARGIANFSVTNDNRFLIAGGYVVTTAGFCAAYSNVASSGLYNPATNTWSAAAAPSFSHRMGAISFTVGTKTYFWGGTSMSGSCPLGTSNASGAVYDRSTNTWAAMPTANAPLAGSTCTITSANKFVCWGRATLEGVNNGGSIFNPSTNLWTVMSTAGAPSARLPFAQRMVGENKLVVWGGMANFGSGPYYNDGAVYDLTTNSWSAMSSVGAPAPLEEASLGDGLSTTKILIWGKNKTSGYAEGAVYNVSTNSWSSIPYGTIANSAKQYTMRENSGAVFVFDPAGGKTWKAGY